MPISISWFIPNRVYLVYGEGHHKLDELAQVDATLPEIPAYPTEFDLS